MAAVLAVVVMNHTSEKSEDQMMTSFAFTTPSTEIVESELSDIASDLEAFYNVIPAGHNAISGFLSPVISREVSAAEIRFFDLTGHLDGSAHGSPIYVVGFTVGAMVPGAEGLPSELAVVLSFRSDYASDPEFGPSSRPRARRRGRVYIGPLTKSAVEHSGVANRPAVSQGIAETIGIRAAALRDSVDHVWCVWSRANAALTPVITAWVDDAFDVQRRRGEDAVTRVVV